jgi:hypothetical protein
VALQYARAVEEYQPGIRHSRCRRQILRENALLPAQVSDAGCKPVDFLRQTCGRLTPKCGCGQIRLQGMYQGANSPQTPAHQAQFFFSLRTAFQGGILQGKQLVVGAPGGRCQVVGGNIQLAKPVMYGFEEQAGIIAAHSCFQERAVLYLYLQALNKGW